MAAVLNIFARLRKAGPEPATQQAEKPHDATARSPAQMIAGCEYELRQLRRDVLLTRQLPGAPRALTAGEPFVLGTGLRNRAAR